MSILGRKPDLSASEWHTQTEYIIAVAGLAFSILMFAVYSGSAQVDEGEGSSYLTRVAVQVFPVICAARLAYVHWLNPNRVFVWCSALLDVLFLSVIIYFFSDQYHLSAASLKAPTFSFYFALIALHAIRFDVRIVIATGLTSALAWAIMVAIFAASGDGVTHSYVDYVSSSAVLVGAEVEKIFALLVYTAMLGLGVKRADEVLQDAAEKHASEVKAQEAEKTVQLKTEFLANMSHEIRTPMNGVLGMTQILRKTDLQPDQMEFVDTIQRSGDALLTIINDILDFSKIEAGQLRLDSAQFNLAEACEDVATLLGVTARQKEIELVVHVAPEIPVDLVGDAGRLRQILTNLIGNAIKFTEKGHVLVEVKGVEIAGIAHISCSIKDTGIGIASGNLAGVFDQFSQADGSTTRRFGGTGLGLSISKNLVKLMNGSIKVESTLGEGSTFTFNIEVPTDRRLQAHAERPTAIELSHMRVLIVDDLEVNRRILRLQLRELGAVADVAEDAREAVRRITQAEKAGRPYSIVVTDYQMPEIDGLDLVRALKKRPQFDALQIVVLSSIDSVKVKQGFQALGVVSYMTKPCRANDLQDAIYKAAQNHRSWLLQDLADQGKSGQTAA